MGKNFKGEKDFELQRRVIAYAAQAKLASLQSILYLDIHRLAIATLEAAEGDLHRRSVQTAKALKELGRTPDQFKKINEEAGIVGRDATLTAFEHRVGRYKGEGPRLTASYRQGQGRLSGGLLYNALGSKSMFTATETGLYFGNQNFLDNRAAHWRRLNFGAGDNKDGFDLDSRPFIVGGQVAGIVRLSGARSPEFTMPAGVFRSLDRNGNPRRSPRHGPNAKTAGAQDASGEWIVKPTLYTSRAAGAGINRTRDYFFPGNKNNAGTRVRTRGIAPRRFLDEGLFAIVAWLPSRYELERTRRLNLAQQKLRDRKRNEVVQVKTKGR